MANRFFSFIFFCCLIVTLSRCAQIVPLTGGEKDKKPPVLVSITPADRSVNQPVHKMQVVFKFDEMITAQSVSQKMMINPVLPEMPEVTVAGKTLTLTFDKELQPNTTYFIQLGNSVADLHEGNVFPDLHYMFSTGAGLDTGNITGSITDALWQKPRAGVSVMLYSDLSDSVALRLKPDYYTRSDEKGNYYLSAIKPGQYRLLALDDKNKNQQYDIGEPCGFPENRLRIKNDTQNILISSPGPSNAFIKKKLQPFWGFQRYILNDTFPDAYIITEKGIDNDKYSYELRNDTLEVYYRAMYGSRLEYVFKKGNSPFDTVTIDIPSKATVDSSIMKGPKMSARTEKPVYGVKHDDILLDFTFPVKDIKTEGAFLIMDGKSEKLQLTSESSNEEGNLVTTFLPAFKKRLLNTLSPGKSYKIMFTPGVILDYWGIPNKDTMRISFKTYAADETGKLLLKMQRTDSASAYVVQLLNEKNSIVKEFSGTKKEATHEFYNLLPGSYSLRLIMDKDKNRKFTPSDHLKNKKEEPVFYYQKPIKIPAGWDVEADWMLR